MAETVITRCEAERAAWIKNRKWLDRHDAARRADILARKARQLDRRKADLGDGAVQETETKSRFYRWTHHDDSMTSALGFAAYVVVFVVLEKVVLGPAWAIATGLYGLWVTMATELRVRVWPYLAAAAAMTAVFIVGRHIGTDVWLIHGIAHGIESVTSGLITPVVLSRWYAAGVLSWVQFQIAFGLAWGGWKAYAWGWMAPAIRRGALESAHAKGTKVDKTVKIIGARAAAGQAPKTQQTTTAVACDDDEIPSGGPDTDSNHEDVMKIIGVGRKDKTNG